MKKKTFIFTKHVYLFFLFGPFLLSKLTTFSFLLHLNDLKCYRSAILSFTNNLGIIITIEQHKRKFLGVQELIMVCCFEFLTPLLWGAITFSFIIYFWQFLVPEMCQKEEFNIYLDTKKKEPTLWIWTSVST